MTEIWSTIVQSYEANTAFLWREITHPSLHNYLVLLVSGSLVVWCGELLWPWRKKQSAFRQDFFLDAFYMFFNFFIAPWLFLNALYAIFNQVILKDITPPPLLDLSHWPRPLALLTVFVVQDFTHYWIHRALHQFPPLWRYHQVHHSVIEMGFAAHLRYHWMENVIYKTLTAVPFLFLGITALDLYILHVITLWIGHLNHANLPWNYGPLRFVLNQPVMHLWHHMKELPKGCPNGVNFGLSLSLWDRCFKTGRFDRPPAHLELGFQKVESFPKGFVGQNLNVFGPRIKENVVANSKSRSML